MKPRFNYDILRKGGSHSGRNTRQILKHQLRDEIMDNADIADEIQALKLKKALELNQEALKGNDIKCCVVCNDEIPKARKAIMPSAKTCVGCAE